MSICLIANVEPRSGVKKRRRSFLLKFNLYLDLIKIVVDMVRIKQKLDGEETRKGISWRVSEPSDH